MAIPTSALSFRGLAHSGLVLAGLLLLGVGLGDTIAGRTKMVQYQELLETIVTPPPTNPAALFPTATEGQERQELARAKLAFYHLLVTVGQLLSAVGLILISIGILRLRVHPPFTPDHPARELTSVR